MAIREHLADFFGHYYVIFLVCIGHSLFFALTVSMSWPSPVLPKMSGTEDNPLGDPITPEESDLIGSLMYIGAAVGPLIIIPCAEYFGGKNTLIFLSVLTPLSYGIFLFAEIVELYYVGRVIQGVFLGGTLSVQPVYLSELIAEEEREFYMSFATMFGFAGMMIVYAVGPFVPLIYFNGFFFVLGIVIVILVFFGIPNTPFYVMKTEGMDATKELLMLIRNEYKKKEADEIKKTIESEVRGSFFELFSSWKNLKIFVAATMPLLLQQFCGIAILLTYSQLIFEKSDIALDPAVCSIIIAVFQVSTSFLTPLILKSGRFSMKAMMAFCLTGMALCNFALFAYFFFLIDNSSLNWILLLSLILFVPFYNCGIDPLPWINMGQVYPKNISSVGSAMTTSIYFLASFPSLFLFTKIDTAFLFLFCACSCTLGVPYILFVFTEYKEA